MVCHVVLFALRDDKRDQLVSYVADLRALARLPMVLRRPVLARMRQLCRAVQVADFLA